MTMDSSFVQFTRETLPLHQTASGCTYEIDVYRYNHPNASQTVYLQGGLHGIELGGVPVVYEFMEEIERLQLATNFIAVPQSNPMGLDSQIMGLQTGYNNLHTNPQNCWNWNRIGYLRHEASQEGHWIHTLLNLVETADISLDFHTAGFEAVPHVYCHTEQVEHVSRLGIPHILGWNTPSHSFSDTVYQMGKVGITFELGCSRRVTGAMIEDGLNYLRRFFHILPPASEATMSLVSQQLKKWYAPLSGVLSWHKQVGETVQAGERLATMYTRKGKKELTSPYTGILLIKYPIHAPHERQELAKFLLPSSM